MILISYITCPLIANLVKYFQYFLSQKINLNSVSSYDEDQPEGRETVLAAGLQTWRIAVSTATSPAQIMLCIIQLNKSISWEKSIMKVVRAKLSLVNPLKLVNPLII